MEIWKGLIREIFLNKILKNVKKLLLMFTGVKETLTMRNSTTNMHCLAVKMPKTGKRVSLNSVFREKSPRNLKISQMSLTAKFYPIKVRFRYSQPSYFRSQDGVRSPRKPRNTNGYLQRHHCSHSWLSTRVANTQNLRIVSIQFFHFHFLNSHPTGKKNN